MSVRWYSNHYEKYLIYLCTVVRVRYEEELYIFREESGLATVCLIKDLETAVGFPVDSITSNDTALSMSRQLNPAIVAEYYNITNTIIL